MATIPNIYIPDIVEICEEAAERAGINFTSGGMLRSAKRSLDLISIEWGNYGLNLWTLDQQVLPLMANTAEYVLPIDTLTVIDSSSLRTVKNGINIDIPLVARDFADYATIVDKNKTGRPNSYYIKRISTPTATFHFVPDKDNTYSFVFWRLRKMQKQGYTDILDLHSSFIPAIISGLAYHLCMKSGTQDYNKIDRLKMKYDEDFLQARYGDNDRSMFQIYPSRLC